MGNNCAVRTLENVVYDNFADYGGSDRKNGIILDGERYMVKFQEHEQTRNANQTSNINNVIAEHLSSRIIATLGVAVHDTLIISIDGELAVACKNFELPGTRHIDFDRFLHRHYDSKDVGRHPTIEQVFEVLKTDRQLGPAFAQNMSSFWDMFVVDALIGNYDRYGGNWGYLARADSNVALQSPLYDNASTFYPTVSEDYILTILEDPKEVAKRVLIFPNSAIEHAGHRLSYYDVLLSGWEGPAASVERIVPNIDTAQILALIEQMPTSEIRKTFYKTMIMARIELLMNPALEAARNNGYDASAKRRLESGARMGASDFERMWQESRDKDTPLDAFCKTYRPVS